MAHFQDMSGVECVDGGVGGVDLLPMLLDADKVILIDAVRLGGAPGTVYRLTPEDLPTHPNVIVSLHDLGLLDVIRLAERLYPERLCPDIVIYGVEAERVEQFTDRLSPAAQRGMEEVRWRVLEELKVKGNSPDIYPASHGGSR